MVNLVIPSEGVNSLIVALSGGKLFGRKLRYLYAGMAMLLWDVPAFAASGIVFAICELAKRSTTLGVMVKGFCAVGTLFFGPLTLALATKVVYDLVHWSKSYERLLRALRRMFTPSVPSS